jgi:VCBS repeat-containing protein
LESGGIVKTVVGTVKAVDPGGIERILQAGDNVHAGETIIVSGGGGVMVDFASGAVFYQASDTQSGSEVEFIDPQSDSGIEFTIQTSAEILAMQDAIAATRKSGSSMPWLEVVDFSDARGSVTSGLDTERGDDDSAFLEIRNIDFNMMQKLPPVNPEPPQNQEPMAKADTNWAQEDAANASGNVLHHLAHNGAPSGTFADVADTDVDGDALTVITTGVSIGTYGTLVLNSNGTYVYTLDSAKAAIQALDTGDAPLTDAFKYTVSDGTATSAATLTISIFGSNDAPVAKADTNWAQEDTINASGNVLQTLAHGGAPSGSFGDVADTDVDVEPLTVVGFFGGNVYGMLTLNPDGSYTYALNNAHAAVQALGDGEKLTDTYIYVVSDGAKLRSTTLTISIFGTNDAPVALADTNWAQEDTANASGNVLRNWEHIGAPSGSFGDVADTDVDGDALTVTTAGIFNGTYGTLVLNSNGAYIYTLDNAAVQVLGTGDAPLTDTFNYTASDGTTTNAATLTITIFGSNDAPVTNADTNWVKDVVSGLTTTQGNVLQNLAHDPPPAPSGTYADVADTDVDGDTLTVTTTGVFIGSYGALVLKSDGSYIYILNSNNAAVNALAESDTPLTDTFSYTVTDGTITSSSSLTITIFGIDEPLVMEDDSNWAQEDVALSAAGNVLQSLAHDGAPYGTPNGTFADAADTGVGLTVTTFTGNIGHGTLTLGTDGAYAYALDNTNAAVQALGAGEILTDTYTYTVTDSVAASHTATLTITVFGTNDAPVARADTNWVQDVVSGVNPFVSGNVLNDGFHPGDPSALLMFADAADTDVDGDLLTVITTGSFVGNYGSLVLNSDGSYAYMLNSVSASVDALDDGERLTDAFTYRVTDGTESRTATLTISIFGTNDAPVAHADTNWAKEDTADASGNVLIKLSHPGDPRGSLTFADVADTDADVEPLTVTGYTGGNVYGALTLNADGSYTYALNNAHAKVQSLDDGGKLTETYIYTITDGTATSTATLTITIFGTNDAPVANADTNWVKDVISGANPTVSGNVLQTLAHGGATSGTYGDVADTDVDIEKLTVTTTGVFTGSYGILVLNSDGSYTYYLNSNNADVNALVEGGPTLADSFSYTVTDGTVSSSSSLTITIFGVNDPVVVSDDSNWVQDVIVGASAPTSTGNVLLTQPHPGAPFGSFGDVADGAGLTVTTTGSFDGAYGILVLNSDGSYTYTLDTGNADVLALNNSEILSDSFSYTASNGASSSLTITIFGINDLPVLQADTNWAMDTTVNDLTRGETVGNVLQDIAHAGAPSGAFADVADTDVDSILAVTGIRLGVAGIDQVVAAGTDATDGTTILGLYGMLRIGADGSYIYDVDQNNPLVDALNVGYAPLMETFIYTVTDGGVSSTSTLSVSVFGRDDPTDYQAQVDMWVPLVDPVTQPDFKGYPINIRVTDVDNEFNIKITSSLPDADPEVDGRLVYYDSAGVAHDVPVGAIFEYGPLLELYYLPPVVAVLDTMFLDTVTYDIVDRTNGALLGQGQLNAYALPLQSAGGGPVAGVGDGNLPLTSGKDQITTVGLDNDAAVAINADPGAAYVNLFTDFQESPFTVPIDEPSRDGVALEQQVQVRVMVDDVTFIIADRGPDDDTWIFDSDSGLMKATVDFDFIVEAYDATRGSGPDWQPLPGGQTLAQYLTAHPITPGDQWEVVYNDNTSGNEQARSVKFEIGTPALTDAGIIAVGTDGVPNQMFGTDSDDTLTGADMNDTFIGRGGNDILSGLGGDDIFQGNKGDDDLSGGSGADTFMWLLDGQVGSVAGDTINDFKVAEYDVLDLKELLVGEHSGTDGTFTYNLGDYLTFAMSGGDTVLTIDVNGTAAAADTTQVITFAATDLFAQTGTSTSAGLIQNLLLTGQLKTDV